MSHLTLVSRQSENPRAAVEHLAHDIRNAAATAVLHVETLEMLAGLRGAKAASAVYALLSKIALICNSDLQNSNCTAVAAHRISFDVGGVVRQIVELLTPLARADFEIRMHINDSFMALANPQDAFRIIFNLAHNAVTAARQNPQMSTLEFRLERRETAIMLHIADDGPGLPAAIRARLFRSPGPCQDTTPTGYGIAIARELAERNGGVIELGNANAGTEFVVVLPAMAKIAIAKRPPPCAKARSHNPANHDGSFQTPHANRRKP
jgi:C4-dicarboxylate-specific signal transduction histidine kinase